ncbi:MAG TPA: hypothetical protein PLA50_03930 [Bacteroidia bacterium]|nr:hypothetical protein [Bacteroidia bacterium]
MRQRLLTFLVFGIALAALGEWGLRSGKFSSLDNLWLDFCIGNAGDQLKDPAVTVVRIDDGYEPIPLGQDEPASGGNTLSRLDYATILAFTSKFSPRSVAFLPIPTFDESLILNKTDIAPLKDAAMKLPKFVAASSVSDDGEQAKEAAALAYPTLKVEGDASGLLAYTRTVRYPDPQILANSVPAFKLVESARDLVSGTSVRVPLVARRGEAVAPSVVLAAVAHHAGVPFDQIVVKLDGPQAQILVGEAYTIPIERDGTLALPARTGLQTPMKRLSRGEDGKPVETMLYTTLTVDELAYTGEENDEVAKRILADLQPEFESLKSNLVVIGFDRTADRRIATSRDEVLSETSLIARTIAVIQSGRYFSTWPTWARVLAVLAIFVIAAVLFRLPRGKFVVASLVSALLFGAVMVFVFSSTLAWTPPFVVFALFSLMLVVGALVPAAAPAGKPADDQEID